MVTILRVIAFGEIELQAPIAALSSRQYFCAVSLATAPADGEDCHATPFEREWHQIVVCPCIRLEPWCKCFDHHLSFVLACVV